MLRPQKYEIDTTGSTFFGGGEFARVDDITACCQPACSASAKSSPYTSHLRTPIQDTGPRLVVYAQTFHDASGSYQSLLPLANNTGITHLIVAAIHLNQNLGNITSIQDLVNITLNNHPPSDPRYDALWDEVRILQSHGIKVLGMLGGAAVGTYWSLAGPDDVFEANYSHLYTLISEKQLDGIDLDIEEPVSIETAERMISRLRRDFGPEFLITMAPIASALLPHPDIPLHKRPPLSYSRDGPMPSPLWKSMSHFSGFSYFELEAGAFGHEIAWYNTQFYCGWGNASTTEWYDKIIAAGWKPEKVLLGVLTHPDHGEGFVDLGTLKGVSAQLRETYRDVGNGFGGVMAWEYFHLGDYGGDRVELAGLGLESKAVQAGWLEALGQVLRADANSRDSFSGT